MIKEISPNLEIFTNFLYEDNTVVSKMLISYYKDYLSLKKSSKELNLINTAMYEYISNYYFYKKVQKFFDIEYSNNLFNDYNLVLQKLSDLYNLYVEGETKNELVSRWL